MPPKVRREGGEEPGGVLGLAPLQQRLGRGIEQVPVGADEHPQELRIVLHPAPNVFEPIVAGQPEPHRLDPGRIASQGYDRADPIADARVGGGEQCGAGADAHGHHDGRRRMAGERGDHGLDVLEPQPPARKPHDRRDRDVEAGPRQENRRLPDPPVALALRGEAVDEHQPDTLGPAGVAIEVRRRAGDAEPAPDGRRGRRREHGSVGQELDQKRGRKACSASGSHDGQDQEHRQQEQRQDLPAGRFLARRRVRRG